jgi:hypothetical protein
MDNAIEATPQRRIGTFAEGMFRTRNSGQRNGTFATGMRHAVCLSDKVHKGTFATGMRRVDNRDGLRKGTFAEGLADPAA